MPLLLLLVTGCARSGNTELLEARLRQQEDRLAETEAHLAEAKAAYRVSMREITALYRKLDEQSTTALLPEEATSLYRVETIEFSKLMTGSLDRDGQPGDEMISAVLLPLDAQGSLVKVAGEVELELIDLSQPEGSRQLGRWGFSTEEVVDHWHDGLISSGYSFQLPWQQPPTSSNLLLHARLTTVDGRMFETSREIVVEVPSGAPALLRASHD